MASINPAKVRSPQSGRPIMAILDLLGRRWALRVLWELHLNGPASFRSLQKLCGDISPTVLNARLSDLREAGIIDAREGEGYVITDTGIELGRILAKLNAWAKGWAEEKGPVRAPGRKTSPGAAGRKKR